MRKGLSALVIFVFMLSSVIMGQTDDDWWNDDSWTGDEWEENFNLDIFNGVSTPFVEVNYGLSNVHNSVLGKNIFGDIYSAELKLGYSKIKPKEEPYLAYSKDKYFFVSNFSPNLNLDNNNSLIKPELWRFGFAERDGYAYTGEYFTLLPYHLGGINWTRLDLSSTDIRTYVPADRDVLNRFNSEFRYGTLNEAGVKLQFGDGFFGVNAGYETAVIFPRYLIWKHFGSFIIEQAAQKAVDEFVEEIMEHSPAAGPVMNFLLKNGLSYAFYQLKKDDMNWPFKTEAPLTIETYKVGLTVTF